MLAPLAGGLGRRRLAPVRLGGRRLRRPARGGDEIRPPVAGHRPLRRGHFGDGVHCRHRAGRPGRIGPVRAGGAALGHRRTFQLVEPVDHLCQRLIDGLGLRVGVGGWVVGRRPEVVEILAQRPDQIGIDAPVVERGGQLVDRGARLGAGRLDRFAMAVGKTRLQLLEAFLDVAQHRGPRLVVFELAGKPRHLRFELGQAAAFGIGAGCRLQPCRQLLDLLFEMVGVGRAASGDLAANGGDLRLDFVERRRRFALRGAQAVDQLDQALQAGVHGRHGGDRRRTVEQIVDARGDLVEPPDDGGRAALGKRRHDVAAERVEPLFQALDRLLRSHRRIAVGQRHLQLLAEHGELAFQALDGLVGVRRVAIVEVRLQFGAERLHAMLEALDGRIERRLLAAVEGRFDAASEFGDAHFEPLDGTRAVVGLERAPERRDFLAEGVEAAPVGAGAGKLFQPVRDRLGARLDLLQRRLHGVLFHDIAQRCEVGADRGQQRTIDRLLGGQRLDAAGEVEGRALVQGFGPVERGHLLAQSGEVGAQRRHRGGQRLLVAAHGERFGALVEHALMRRYFGDGRGEVVPLAVRSGYSRRGRLRCRAVAAGEPVADVAEPLFDARQSGRHRRPGRQRRRAAG